MTNFEFYKDAIAELLKAGVNLTDLGVKDNIPTPCDGTLKCEQCSLDGWCYDGCGGNFIFWLSEPYVDSKTIPATDREISEIDPEILETLEIDAPILCSRDGKTWHERHFAEYIPFEDGTYMITVFTEGRTSWTSRNILIGRTEDWNYYKLPKED